MGIKHKHNPNEIAETQNTTSAVAVPSLNRIKHAKRHSVTRLDTTDRGYDGEHQFEIKSKAVQDTKLNRSGGPRMKTQQWERTNRK